MSEAVLTFDTTHMALRAEEVAVAAGIPVDVIPAPPARRARCDLALVCRPADLPRLSLLLRDARVDFQPPDDTPRDPDVG